MFRYLAIVMVFAFLSTVTGSSIVERNSIAGNLTAETYSSYINVYVVPTGGAEVYVKVWSADDAVTRTFYAPGDMRLTFNAWSRTVFKLDAIWTEGETSKGIFSAAVWGEGAPQKSSSWVLTSSHLRRVAEDSNECPPCDELRRNWIEL